MSEPCSAFLKLRIKREGLVAWLDGPVSPAAHWSDWRGIGGQYYFDGGVGDIADISDAEMADNVTECDRALGGFSNNRAALRYILDAAEAPYLKRCTYRDGVFLAGTLTYAENLIPYMQFLAVARGAAEHLEADGEGLALIHNYIWGEGAEATEGAMRLGPGKTSRFLVETEKPAAAQELQPIVTEMLAIGEGAEDVSKVPPPIDELEDLK